MLLIGLIMHHFEISEKNALYVLKKTSGMRKKR